MYTFYVRFFSYSDYTFNTLFQDLGLEDRRREPSWVKGNSLDFRTTWDWTSGVKSKVNKSNLFIVENGSSLYKPIYPISVDTKSIPFDNTEI